MLSAIDFTSFDNSLPDLPSAAAVLAIAANDKALPPVPQPVVGAQAMPVQDSVGRLRVRPLSFHPHATLVEDRASGTATARMTVDGGRPGKGVSLTVFADKYVAAVPGAQDQGLGQKALPVTVDNTGEKQFSWDTTTTEGGYAFSIYGPDRFVRSFAGAIVPAGTNARAIPRVDAALLRGHGAGQQVRFTLSNDGSKAVVFQLVGNDFLDRSQTISVGAGASKTVTWPTVAGYYDVSVTAAGVDGWKQRYAGRVAQL
jgi:phospholipase C